MDEPQAPLTEREQFEAWIADVRRDGLSDQSYDWALLGWMARAALSAAPVQGVSPEDADLWRRLGHCAVELLPSILRGIADDLRQGLNTDSPKFRHIFAATIDQAAAALASAPHPTSNTLGDASGGGEEK